MLSPSQLGHDERGKRQQGDHHSSDSNAEFCTVADNTDDNAHRNSDCSRDGRQHCDGQLVGFPSANQGSLCPQFSNSAIKEDGIVVNEAYPVVEVTWIVKGICVVW